MAHPATQRRLDPAAEPTTPRALTRAEARSLTWMQSVFVRDLTDGELIEARVKGFVDRWINVLFPSGEGVSFEHGHNDADAVSDCGRYVLVVEDGV